MPYSTLNGVDCLAAWVEKLANPIEVSAPVGVPSLNKALFFGQQSSVSLHLHTKFGSSVLAGSLQWLG